MLCAENGFLIRMSLKLYLFKLQIFFHISAALAQWLNSFVIGKAVVNAFCSCAVYYVFYIIFKYVSQRHIAVGIKTAGHNGAVA